MFVQCVEEHTLIMVHWQVIGKVTFKNNRILVTAKFLHNHNIFNTHMFTSYSSL